jgi:hypothetical protein
MSPHRPGTVHPYTGDGMIVSELQGISPYALIGKMQFLNPRRKSKRRILIDEVRAVLDECVASRGVDGGGVGGRDAAPPVDERLSDWYRSQSPAALQRFIAESRESAPAALATPAPHRNRGREDTPEHRDDPSQQQQHHQHQQEQQPSRQRVARAARKRPLGHGSAGQRRKAVDGGDGGGTTQSDESEHSTPHGSDADSDAAGRRVTSRVTSRRHQIVEDDDDDDDDDDVGGSDVHREDDDDDGDYEGGGGGAASGSGAAVSPRVVRRSVLLTPRRDGAADVQSPRCGTATGTPGDGDASAASPPRSHASPAKRIRFSLSPADEERHAGDDGDRGATRRTAARLPHQKPNDATKRRSSAGTAAGGDIDGTFQWSSAVAVVVLPGSLSHPSALLAWSAPGVAVPSAAAAEVPTAVRALLSPDVVTVVLRLPAAVTLPAAMNEAAEVRVGDRSVVAVAPTVARAWCGDTCLHAFMWLVSQMVVASSARCSLRELLDSVLKVRRVVCR